MSACLSLAHSGSCVQIGWFLGFVSCCSHLDQWVFSCRDGTGMETLALKLSCVQTEVEVSWCGLICTCRKIKCWALSHSNLCVCVCARVCPLQKAYCGHCAERIWGLGTQGYKCITCKLLVHKRCHRLLPQTCQSLMVSASRPRPGFCVVLSLSQPCVSKVSMKPFSQTAAITWRELSPT